MASERRRIGTALEIGLLKNLKVQAAKENRPMADLIADAITIYLAKPDQNAAKRHSFQTLLKEPALRASFGDIQSVLEQDLYAV